MPPDIENQIIAAFLPWILLAGLASILATAFRVLIWPKLKGRLGEASINFLARRFLDPAVYHLIPDVMLPTPDGTTQIDHVIVSRYGIFVLETKAYKGWILGGEREAQWTQVNFKRKDRFQNPLRQNYKHVKTLADLTGIPEECFKSLVVFTDDCTFKTAMPANVVYIQDFVRYIKGFRTPIIKDEQVVEIVGVIGEWAGTVTDRQKAGHVANLRRNKEPAGVTEGTPVCPRCGSGMVLRSRRADGGNFWGCPKFPACRGVREA
jgi:hypothetical protein